MYMAGRPRGSKKTGAKKGGKKSAEPPMGGNELDAPMKRGNALDAPEGADPSGNFEGFGISVSSDDEMTKKGKAQF